MDVEGVHTVEAPCRRVHSPMEDFYSPSWTCMLQGFSPQGIDCTALPLGVPFDHNSSSVQVLWEIDFDQPSSWISNPLEIPAVKTGQTPNDQEAILHKRLGTVN